MPDYLYNVRVAILRDSGSVVWFTTLLHPHPCASSVHLEMKFGIKFSGRRGKYMNIFNIIKCWIQDAVNADFPEVGEVSNFVVEFPKEGMYGDIATSIAMSLASKLKLPPLQIAERIVSSLKKSENNKTFRKIEVIPPGFINIFLNLEFWHEFITCVNAIGKEYGNCNLGCGEQINIEFVSANPTGPMHIGHARGAVYGDALANLLAKSGFRVVREYYVNDAGKQIETLVKSLWIRYQQMIDKNVSLTEECYPGAYLCDIASQLRDIYENTLFDLDVEKRNEILKDFAIKEIMDGIKEDLCRLGVKHDIFISEQKDIRDRGEIESAISILEESGLLYRGMLEKPKSKTPEDWESHELLLFKSTLFGDDIDRPVLRSDGTPTYFAPDIAYHKHKIERGFNKMLVLLGADHSGYVKRIQAVVKALSDGKAEVSVLISQMVNLIRDGKPLKMSKRAGNFVTLREVLEELGKDILRFCMLTRKSDTVFDLDFNKAREQSNDNPVFYVQYAHTRAVSIIYRAQSEGIIDKGEINVIDGLEKVNYEYSHGILINYKQLAYDTDVNLIKQIAMLPKTIELAASSYEPHRIAYYLYDLANAFHATWSKGIEEEKLRFIQAENTELSRARIALVYAVAHTIGIGLDLMGIKPMLQM
ncbi:Arginine--tRNA ligase [Alphaproteobacteria bacterium]